MKDLLYYKKCLKYMICLYLLSIFITSNTGLYISTYVLVLALMVIRSIRINTTLLTKFYLICVYSLIYVAQITYINLVLFNSSVILVNLLNNFIATLFIITPFIIEKIVTVKKYIDINLPSIEDIYTVSFNEFRTNKDRIINSFSAINSTRKKLSIKNFKNVILDLPRHSSFRYISNGNLTDDYFKKAYLSIKDPNIYIIISRTCSPASELISVFTHKHYNHASIAFDKELETIVSYNGGEKVYPPGLNYEIIDYFIKKNDSAILVYSIKATKKQKKKIIDKIKQINDEGSAYNLLGLVLKQSFKPNIMFCSQFVYKMLELGDLTYFNMNPKHVKPTDFIEKDYYKKAKFEYNILSNKNFKI